MIEIEHRPAVEACLDRFIDVSVQAHKVATRAQREPVEVYSDLPILSEGHTVSGGVCFNDEPSQRTRLPTEEGLVFKHWPGPGIETAAWDYDLRPHGPALCVLRRAGLRFSKQVPNGPGAVRVLIYRLCAAVREFN